MRTPCTSRTPRLSLRTADLPAEPRPLPPAAHPGEVEVGVLFGSVEVLTQSGLTDRPAR